MNAITAPPSTHGDAAAEALRQALVQANSPLRDAVRHFPGSRRTLICSTSSALPAMSYSLLRPSSPHPKVRRRAPVPHWRKL